MSTTRVNRGLQRRSASRHGGNAHKSQCEEPKTSEQDGRVPVTDYRGGGKPETVKRGESTNLPVVLI